MIARNTVYGGRCYRDGYTLLKISLDIYRIFYLGFMEENTRNNFHLHLKVDLGEHTIIVTVFCSTNICHSVGGKFWVKRITG